MSLSLFEILSVLETDEEIHLGRLVILLYQFVGANGKKSIGGLTKVAKLDFLLRYPVFLERALIAKGKNPEKVNVKDHERLSVESKMVRYKYGPWDHRYHRFINILVGKDIVYFYREGKKINMGLSEKGLEIGKELSEDASNQDLVGRAKLLKQHFDQTGNTLMKFIYQTFPEIGTLGYGIRIENEI